MALKSNFLGGSSGLAGRNLMLLMVLAVGWVFLAETGLLAQTPTGSVTGLVTDQSGAVVPGATLTLVNTDTGISSTSQTDSNGYYTFTLIPPGNYRMSVEKVGFQTIVRSGVRLEVQQTARLDFAMQVGAVRQAVTVTAAAPLLQQGTSSLSQLVNQHNVAELPLLGRNPYALVLLVPGVYAPPRITPCQLTSSHRATFRLTEGAATRMNISSTGFRTQARPIPVLS